MEEKTNKTESYILVINAIRDFIESNYFSKTISSGGFYKFCSLKGGKYGRINNHYIFNNHLSIEAICKEICDSDNLYSSKPRESVKENVQKLIKKVKNITTGEIDSYWRTVAIEFNMPPANIQGKFHKYFRNCEVIQFIAKYFDIKTLPTLNRNDYKSYFDLCYEKKICSHLDYKKSEYFINRKSQILCKIDKIIEHYQSTKKDTQIKLNHFSNKGVNTDISPYKLNTGGYIYCFKDDSGGILIGGATSLDKELLKFENLLSKDIRVIRSNNIDSDKEHLLSILKEYSNEFVIKNPSYRASKDMSFIWNIFLRELESK